MHGKDTATVRKFRLAKKKKKERKKEKKKRRRKKGMDSTRANN